jgi:hypothetical protein
MVGDVFFDLIRRLKQNANRQIYAGTFAIYIVNNGKILFHHSNSILHIIFIFAAQLFESFDD